MRFSYSSLIPEEETSADAAPEPSCTVHSKNISHKSDTLCLPDVLEHPEYLGTIEHGYDKHFYTRGAFDLVQLVLYILRQTGPADVVICTYSVAEQTLKTLHRMVESGEIRSIRFLIDNRVRSISPKPFDVLVNTFPGCYRCLALHAKVALISNNEWKISVVGSQNATHNPKLERGIIHTSPQIYAFDEEILDQEYESGNT